jgi:hypothetical protein
MLTFTQMVCPTLTCKFSPSSRIASAKRARLGDDTGNHKMVGEDHEVEPANATTATVPWLLTYFLLASCSKMGHSGCPTHNRRSQKWAFQALQAFVKLAARVTRQTRCNSGHHGAQGTFRLLTISLLMQSGRLRCWTSS